MEVDICVRYPSFIIVVTDTGLTAFYFLYYLMTYLMIELPTYLRYPATWFTHTTQKCLLQSR